MDPMGNIPPVKIKSRRPDMWILPYPIHEIVLAIAHPLQAAIHFFLAGASDQQLSSDAPRISPVACGQVERRVAAVVERQLGSSRSEATEERPGAGVQGAKMGIDPRKKVIYSAELMGCHMIWTSINMDLTIDLEPNHPNLDFT